MSPLFSREEAERHGQISTAEVGLARPLRRPQVRRRVLRPQDGPLRAGGALTDILGTRFLVRKIKDEAPHVPPLEQVRSEVALAWKTSKARPLAEKAADDLASQLKAKGARSRTPKSRAIASSPCRPSRAPRPASCRPRCSSPARSSRPRFPTFPLPARRSATLTSASRPDPWKWRPTSPGRFITS